MYLPKSISGTHLQQRHSELSKWSLFSCLKFPLLVNILFFFVCFALFFSVLVCNLSSDSAFPSLPFHRAVSMLFLSFSNWSMAPQAIKQEQTLSHTTSHYNGLTWPLYTLGVWNSVFSLSWKTLNFFFFFFWAFPSYISGVHHSWVRFLRMWPFFNPTIKVVTFRLRGWCVLGVFLLPAFTRLGHERQDLLSPCDEMHVCTD